MRLAVRGGMFTTTMDLMLSADDRRVLTTMLRATTINAPGNGAAQGWDSHRSVHQRDDRRDISRCRAPTCAS
jgi:hypothetical protein